MATTAERMRTLRQRKLAGERCINLTVPDRALAGLVAAGRLTEADRDNRQAIAAVIGAVLDDIAPAIPAEPVAAIEPPEPAAAALCELAAPEPEPELALGEPVAAPESPTPQAAESELELASDSSEPENWLIKLISGGA